MSDQGPVIYANEALPVYLDDAPSGKPAPGGGSVSACVGALGAALTSLVCPLTIGKEQFAAVGGRMREVLAASAAARARLQRLLQDDTSAYGGVLAAYRLPKDTDEQRAARHQAVQDGLVVAADVPLQICRVAVEVYRLAKVAADLGNANAVPDAGLGALLRHAAAVGAALTVRIHLGSRHDADYVRRTPAAPDAPPPAAPASRAARAWPGPGSSAVVSYQETSPPSQRDAAPATSARARVTSPILPGWATTVAFLRASLGRPASLSLIHIGRCRRTTLR